MKRTFVFILVLVALASCKKPKDYAEMTIKLEGLKPTDTVLTVRGMGINRQFKLENGVFHDTIKLEKGNFMSMILNRETNFQVFLKNNDNITVSGNVEKLDSTITFKGNGSENNNYLLSRVDELKNFNKVLEKSYAKDSLAFDEDIDAFETKMTNLLDNNKALDTTLVNMEKKGLSGFIDMLRYSYPQKHAYMVKFGKGQPSPTFENLRNFDGSKTSLKDFKGQFVYIDLWATWCKPCLAQIPALKELEDTYKGKNVAFVSISTDKEADFIKWHDMVKKENLGGTQLFAGDNIEFPTAYEVRGIPRFILIDPDGNIVAANAPRPAMKDDIKKLFEDAGIK